MVELSTYPHFSHYIFTLFKNTSTSSAELSLKISNNKDCSICAETTPPNSGILETVNAIAHIVNIKTNDFKTPSILPNMLFIFPTIGSFFTILEINLTKTLMHILQNTKIKTNDINARTKSTTEISISVIETKLQIALKTLDFCIIIATFSSAPTVIFDKNSKIFVLAFIKSINNGVVLNDITKQNNVLHIPTQDKRNPFLKPTKGKTTSINTIIKSINN